ncbi:hypothetical protein D9M68_945320 [compost metagenome]
MVSMASPIWPPINCSKRSMIRARSPRPSMALTVAAVTVPLPWEMAWSSKERLSRAEPSPARTIMASASGSKEMPSCPRIDSR